MRIGLLRHARVHRGLGDSDGNRRDQARIKRHRDDVLRAEAGADALVSRGDIIGHILAGEIGQRLGGGDLHVVVDGRCPHVERAAEDVGKAQDIVDLVGIIGPSGGDDGVIAHRGDLLGRDFRIRIGHGEDDRVLGHLRRPSRW
jgi:hypothetical protein